MGCSGADEIRESMEWQHRGQQQRASHSRVKLRHWEMAFLDGKHNLTVLS